MGLDYRDHVVTVERYLRPAEVDLLVGDFAKARTTLGWQPETSFEELVGLMVDAELHALQRREVAAIPAY